MYTHAIFFSGCADYIKTIFGFAAPFCEPVCDPCGCMNLGVLALWITNAHFMYEGLNTATHHMYMCTRNIKLPLPLLKNFSMSMSKSKKSTSNDDDSGFLNLADAMSIYD